MNVENEDVVGAARKGPWEQFFLCQRFEGHFVLLYAENLYYVMYCDSHMKYI